MKLYIDFETRSSVNLLRAGAHIYASSPSTEVILVSYAIDDSPVKVFENVVPEEFAKAVKECEYMVAWNAQFERLLFHKLVLPPVSDKKWYCAQTQARNCNLPPKLMDCSYVLGGKGLTDTKIRGDQLIRMFSIPEYSTKDSNPTEWEEFVKYCEMDTEVTRQIHKLLKPLTKWELAEYHASEQINDRGIQIDKDLCKGAALTDINAEEHISNTVKMYTGQDKLRGQGLALWVHIRLPKHLQALMADASNKSGITFKDHTKNLLLAADDLPFEVRKVLEAVRNVGGNAIKKFASMYERCDEEGIARGGYLHCGTHTGRYSSVGIQLQNLPRDKMPITGEDTKQLFYYHVKSGTYYSAEKDCRSECVSYTQSMKALVRHCIMARKGKQFYCIDWEQIEGRIAPWLAQGIDRATTQLADNKLKAYADPRRDVYCETAEDILGRPVSKHSPERQSYGKTSELALGYGGSTGALETMANAYSVELADPENVVNRWRNANKWAVNWWYAVSRAAINAYKNPGKTYPAGRVEFTYYKTYLKGTLVCKLPSGRLQQYPFCKLVEDKYGEQLVSLRSKVRPKANEKEWPSIRLWHGVLCENITQATAGCLLRNRLTYLTGKGLQIVGHTHDEILIEYEHEREIANVKEYCTKENNWWKGLPLSIESWQGSRFKK